MTEHWKEKHWQSWHMMSSFPAMQCPGSLVTSLAEHFPELDVATFLQELKYCSGTTNSESLRKTPATEPVHCIMLENTPELSTPCGRRHLAIPLSCKINSRNWREFCWLKEIIACSWDMDVTEGPCLYFETEKQSRCTVQVVQDLWAQTLIRSTTETEVTIRHGYPVECKKQQKDLWILFALVTATGKCLGKQLWCHANLWPLHISKGTERKEFIKEYTDMPLMLPKLRCLALWTTES